MQFSGTQKHSFDEDWNWDSNPRICTFPHLQFSVHLKRNSVGTGTHVQIIEFLLFNWWFTHFCVNPPIGMLISHIASSLNFLLNNHLLYCTNKHKWPIVRFISLSSSSSLSVCASLSISDNIHISIPLFEGNARQTVSFILQKMLSDWIHTYIICAALVQNLRQDYPIGWF